MAHCAVDLGRRHSTGMEIHAYHKTETAVLSAVLFVIAKCLDTAQTFIKSSRYINYGVLQKQSIMQPHRQVDSNYHNSTDELYRHDTEQMKLDPQINMYSMTSRI